MAAPRTLARLAVLAAVCLLLPACVKNKVTKANFDAIKEGMTLADVEKLLGKGTKEEGDGTNVAAQFGVHVEAAPRSGSGSSYTWERGGNSITVHFNKDGKVVNKRSSGF
jgi:hypothetical protein